MEKKAYEELVIRLGDEITLLDRMTYKLLVDGLTKDEKNSIKWATYAQLLVEIKKIGNHVLYQEFQYYITDNRIDRRRKVLELLESIKNKTPELIRLESKIMKF